MIVQLGVGMNECQINTNWGGCCCNCKYLVKINLHCSEQRSKGYQTSDDGCNCHIQIGFGCAVFAMLYGNDDIEKGEHSTVYWYGDTKHGFCELHEPIDLSNRNARKCGTNSLRKEMER